nr:hypothetical protein [Candidatus Freyarchaeota archaeon]
MEEKSEKKSTNPNSTVPTSNGINLAEVKEESMRQGLKNCYLFLLYGFGASLKFMR